MTGIEPAALRANWRPPRGLGGGAARESSALLQGRIRCGKCGRMMQTGYSGVKGNCPRYVCARAKQLYGGQKDCQSIGGRRLEQRVLEEVFAVLAPAALTATGQALGQMLTGGGDAEAGPLGEGANIGWLMGHQPRQVKPGRAGQQSGRGCG